MSRTPDYVRKHYGPLLQKTLRDAVSHVIGEQFPRIGGPRMQALCAELILDPESSGVRPSEHVRHGQARWLGIATDDLAQLMSRNDAAIAQVLTAHESRTGQLVPRRATLHDAGTGLTHKRIICWKRYAEGKPADLVARQTCHSLESVDRYLGRFDGVRHCRRQGLSPEKTAFTLDCSVSLVNEYLAIDRELEGQ